MRFLGFDVIDARSEERNAVMSLFFAEDRMMLTRDRYVHQQILRAGKTSFLIKSDLWRSQLKGVFDRFHLQVDSGLVGTRCMICNALLESVDPAEIAKEVPCFVFQTHTVFTRCQRCHKVFWHGTHVDRLMLDLSIEIDRNDSQTPLKEREG